LEASVFERTKGEEAMKVKNIILGLLLGSAISVGTGVASAQTANGREIRRDARELRLDNREIRSDRRELRRDLRNGAGPGEIRSDKRDLRRDKRDRRLDRRDLRRDLRK
jgi:hypothetical protein